MRPDDATLLDMLNAARQALAFVGDMGKPAFLEDPKTQSAILHQLLLLGEAIKRLSPQFRATHDAIPLKVFAGMRDVLIHQYDSVDLDEVWRTLQEDVPALIEAILPLAPRPSQS